MCLATMVILYAGFLDNSKAVVRPVTPALDAISGSAVVSGLDGGTHPTTTIRGSDMWGTLSGK